MSESERTTFFTIIIYQIEEPRFVMGSMYLSTIMKYFGFSVRTRVMQVIRSVLFALTACIPLLSYSVYADDIAIIEGTVFSSDGQPLTNESVSINVFSGSDACGSLSWVANSGPIDTALGTFTISNIPPGTYYLKTQGSDTTYLNEWWTTDSEGATNCQGAISLSVYGGETKSEINFKLNQGAKISGQVSGNYGNNVCILAFASTDTCRLFEHDFYSTLLGSNGNYNVTVPAGTYYLVFDPGCQGNPDNLVPEWWTMNNEGTTDCNLATTFPLAVGDETIKNITLDQPGGSITGTVFNSSGQPLTGVPLRVNVYSGDRCGHRAWQNSVEINTDGTYIINAIPPGTYYLITWNNGTLYPDEYWTGGANDSDAGCQNAQPITIVSGSIESDKDFQLDQGARIIGHITGEYGDNICIRAHPSINNDTCDSSQWAGGTNLNNGNQDYDITMPAGTYFLEFDPNCGTNSNSLVKEYWTEDSQGTADCGQANTFELTVGQEGIKNITLDVVGGKITGTVSDSNGQSLTGAPVHVNVYSGEKCGEQTWVAGSGEINTNDGTYTINGIPPGTYYLNTWNNNTTYINEWYRTPASTTDCNYAQPVIVTAGVTKDGINFQLDQGAKISGHVNGAYGDNTICIAAMALSNNDACNSDQWVGGTRVDDNGDYSFAVPVGTVFLTFDPNCGDNPSNLIGEYWTEDSEGSTDCAEADPFDLTVGQNATKNITLDQHGGRIAGTLSDDNGPINGDQHEIGVNVITGDPCGDNQYIDGDHLVADGTYSVIVPINGQYYVRSFSNNGEMYLQKWFAGFDGGGQPVSSLNCQDAVALSFQPDQDLIDNIDLHLEIGGGITGTIFQADGVTPITGEWQMGANVWIGADPCRNLQHVQGAGINSEDGTYTLNGLPAGTYYLKNFIQNPDSYYTEEYWAPTASTTNCASAQPITVTAGQFSANHNFQLDVGGKMTGTLYEADGTTPITGQTNIGANVRVGPDPCDAEHVKGTNLNTDDGTFSLSGLPAGDYWLGSWAPEGYSDEYWRGDRSTSLCFMAQKVTVVAGATTVDKNLQMDTDSDGDEIGDYDEEHVLHTDKNLRDSDGDGIDDYAELYLWGDNFNGDADGDGIWNINEVDADNDGVTDRQELVLGTDMGNSSSTPNPLTLYDDFSSGSLASDKWANGEQAAEVQNGTLRLMLDSSEATTQEVRTVAITQQNIKSIFLINELSVNPGGKVLFNINGNFYHTQNNPSTITGRVYASLSIGDIGSNLGVTYYIGRFTSEDGQLEEIASGPVNVSQTLATGTTYQLEIKYDGTSGFTFAIYNQSSALLGSAAANGPAFGAVLSDRRSMEVISQDKGGKIDVSVEQFETGNGNESYTVYDDFSTTRLDGGKWITPEIAREVEDNGTLKLLTHSYGDQLTTRAKLAHRYNYFETKVRIDSNRFFQQGSTIGRVRLDGYLYNDSHGPGSGTPYDGSTGDVWAQVVINYTEDGLQAYAYAERYNNADETAWEDLFWDELNIPLAFDTDYVLYIGFSKDFLLCGIDSADGVHHALVGTDISTSKYLSFNKTFELTARERGGQEGMIMAHFDDVRVSGEPLEKPGDINGDGNIDLQDVIIGLQAITGTDNNNSWKSGDTDGDGKIGLPEVLDSLKQQVSLSD